MTQTSYTLSGICVLDLGDRPASAWCSRLLGDFGADVVGVEPEGGHALRSEGPFDDRGVSIPATYVLANRRRLSALAARAHLAELVRDADVIITTAHADAPLGVDELVSSNPGALVVAITPYGLNGKRAHHPGNDLTACASSGWAFVNGLQGRPPLKSSGYQASYQTGTFAFGIVVSALLERTLSSAGQTIDIAERDVLVSTSSPAPLRYQYSGMVWSRREAVDMNEGPVPVRDGWFALTLSRPAFWIKAMEVLGLPELAADPELQQAGLRPKLKHRFVDRVGEAMRGWDRMELFDALARRRVIAGPVLRMNELADNPQFEDRGFLRRDAAGTRWPGPFAAFSHSRWRVPETRDEDNDDYGGFDPSPIDVVPVRAGRAEPEGRGPLSGFRGLVLTQAWAGTYATQMLGLLGADVIQLETRGRLDSWRGTYQNPIPKCLKDSPAARHAWNCSPLYNSVNLNKRCITVDLSDPEGLHIFRDLVDHADFVAENFSPRVVGNLGVDYASVVEIRPDIVYASLSAYGATGPWSTVPGIGGTIEPSSGMSALLGYDGEHPMNSGQMYPDPVAGLCGFAAIALALLHRDRTGEGQYIDLSMREANFGFVGDAWLEYELMGNVRGPMGNRHPTHAPHGVFAAAPVPGDPAPDQWIAFAAQSDRQWHEIADLLGLVSPTYATQAERKAREFELEALINERTASWDKHELAHALCLRGVPAAAVVGPHEIVGDADLRARGAMVEVVHPEAGAAWQPGLPAFLGRTPGGVSRAAPLQGEHNLDVFREFLNMDDATYEGLCEQEITGVGPSSTSSVVNQA